MQIAAIGTLAVLSIAVASQAEAKGCTKGAIVGGIAGHYAGHGVRRHGRLGRRPRFGEAGRP